MREFRVHHDEYLRRGIEVAGVARDSVESNRSWSERLHLPYPLLSDVDGAAGRAFRVARRLGIGSWTIELFRRSTFLIDDRGEIAAVWGKVRVRGHATEVLEMARALGRAPEGAPPTPASPSPPPA
jgi:peroxiredoxin Q/BCP